MESDKKIIQYKITYIADIGSKNRTGGGQTFAKLFLDILLNNQYINAQVFLTQAPIDNNEVKKYVDLEYSNISKIDIIDLPDSGIGKPQVDILFFLKIRKRIKIFNPDIYIFDQPNTIELFLPYKPSLSMFHGGTNFNNSKFRFQNPRTSAIKTFWQKPLLTKIIKRYFDKSNNNIPLFNSQYSLRKLKEDFDFDFDYFKKYITWLPIDNCNMQFSYKNRMILRDKFNLLDDDIVVLYLSNFASKKRVNIAPDILKYLKNYSNIKHFFIGRSIDSKILDEYCKLHSNCFRIDEISFNEVSKYYSFSDIVITYSLTETFGYSVAEGMLCEKPHIIFNNSGALTEFVVNNKNGFIVNSNKEFADRILLLANDKDLRIKLGYNARETIINNFGIKEFEHRFYKILEKI